MAAPAKINLALHVTGRRADGYHLIESLAVFTRFGDRIAIEPAPTRTRFAVSGPLRAPPSRSTTAISSSQARDALRGAMPAGGCRAGRDRAGEEPAGRLRHRRRLQRRGGGAARRWRDSGPRYRRRSARRASAWRSAPTCRCALPRKPLVARGIGDELSPCRGFPGAGAGAGQSRRRRRRRRTCSRRSPRRDNAPLPPLPPRIDFHTPAQLAGDHPQRSRGAGAGRSRRRSARRSTALEQGRRRLRAHVGFRRDLLRPVRDRQCGQARGSRDPQPPPGWFVAATRSMPSEADAMAMTDETPPLHSGPHRGADRLRYAHARRRQIRPDAGRPHRRGRPRARRPRHRHRRRATRSAKGCWPGRATKASTWSSPPAAPASPAAT